MAEHGITRRTLGAGAHFGLTALAAQRRAAAQDFPTRPIRVIVPYTPGGASDIIARLMAEQMAPALGQPLVVENRGGGASVPGTQAMATAAPDGHTIGVIDSSFTINPTLLGPARLPYDTRRDFAPIALLVTAPLTLVIHPGVPADDLAAFVALAKARPGRMSHSSAGIGTAVHLAGEQFKQAAGVDLVHVPYRSGGPSVADLIAGQVQMTFATVPSVLDHIRSGRLRALAVTGGARSPLLPEVPSTAEAGLPGVDAELLNGMVAPAAVPPAILARLAAAVSQPIATPGPFRERLIGMGFRPVGSTPAEFAARIEAEIARWAKVIRDGNIQAE
jgi:tripartite-type tricarboxylate transporter receptor subunit TctC